MIAPYRARVSSGENISARRRTRGALLRVLSLPIRAIVVLYILFDDLIFPLFRPLARWIAALRLTHWLQKRVAGLPRYGVLAVLALPMVIAEPAKIYGFYLLGTDRIAVGVPILVVAYLVSLVVVERIFVAGRSKLMTIGWFARLWSWFTALRDRVTEWIQSTRLWRQVKILRARMRRMIDGLFRSARRGRARTPLIS